MSTKYKKSKDVPTSVLAKRLDELSDAIVERMKGRNSKFESEFTCRIPCELDRDPDMVLGEAATRLKNNNELLKLIHDDLKMRSKDGVVNISDFIWQRLVDQLGDNNDTNN